LLRVVLPIVQGRNLPANGKRLSGVEGEDLSRDREQSGMMQAFFEHPGASAEV